MYCAREIGGEGGESRENKADAHSQQRTNDKSFRRGEKETNSKNRGEENFLVSHEYITGPFRLLAFRIHRNSEDFLTWIENELHLAGRPCSIEDTDSPWSCPLRPWISARDRSMDRGHCSCCSYGSISIARSRRCRARCATADERTRPSRPCPSVCTRRNFSESRERVHRQCY